MERKFDHNPDTQNYVCDYCNEKVLIQSYMRPKDTKISNTKEQDRLSHPEIGREEVWRLGWSEQDDTTKG